MRKIALIAATLTALSTSAVAQIAVDTDAKVGRPGATKSTGQGKSMFDTYEKNEDNVKAPQGAGGAPSGRRQHGPIAPSPPPGSPTR